MSMNQEKLHHIIASYYSKNKDNRSKLKRFRSITALLRRLRIPIYKNIFDNIHFRSYFPVLEMLLTIEKPRIVFEWGPGLNTTLFVRNGAKVYSVEHDQYWYDLYKNKQEPGVVSIFSKLENNSFLDYPSEIAKTVEAVDMAFVDARCRVQCIQECKKKNVPIVVMHDSLHFTTMQPATDGSPPVFNETKLCKDGYASYRYFIEVVDFRTIILVDDKNKFDAISKLFSDFYVVEGPTSTYDSVIRAV